MRCWNVVIGGGGNPNFTLRSARKEGVDFDVLRIEQGIAIVVDVHI